MNQEHRSIQIDPEDATTATTYLLAAQCKNCDWCGKVAVPKGLPVAKGQPFPETIPCQECGCTTLVRPAAANPPQIAEGYKLAIPERQQPRVVVTPSAPSMETTLRHWYETSLHRWYETMQTPDAYRRQPSQREQLDQELGRFDANELQDLLSVKPQQQLPTSLGYPGDREAAVAPTGTMLTTMVGQLGD